MTFLSRYQDRPSVLKVEREVATNMHIDLERETITKSRKGTVHSLNDFDITVWEDGEVTAQRKYYVSSSPDKHFPNMSVSDGAITLPIEDLVSFILARISPLELAEGIMADDEARQALVDKMAERYNSPGFDDEDRQTFLTKVQQQIHAVAIGRAIERLNKIEEVLRAKDDYNRWRSVELGHYRNLYEKHETALYELREAGKLDDEGVRVRKSYLITPDSLAAAIKEFRDPVTTESVGPAWHESRDYWRKRLEESFPEPATPALSEHDEGGVGAD